MLTRQSHPDTPGQETSQLKKTQLFDIYGYESEAQVPCLGRGAEPERELAESPCSVGLVLWPHLPLLGPLFGRHQ